MATGNNETTDIKPSAERVNNKDAALNSQEDVPQANSLKLDKTQFVEVKSDEKLSEKSQNCVTWSQKTLKAAKISKITQEFRDCKEYKPDVKTSVSEKMSEKNRYNHIVCANENRVVLKDRDSSNDYIHASWMEMPDGVQFISTQGPIKNTITDFWHMIYTEKCSVIVMLCNYVEDEQEKCQKYFLENGGEKEYGEYKVKIVEKTVEIFSPVKVTVLQVQKKNSSTKHLVHHYWYHDWHDQVAPLDPAPMIKMYKAVIKKAGSKPIVVHCSAGVGRTATFVGIHLGQVMVRENASVEMVDILKRLRKMRLGAIQSQLQYVYLIILIIHLFIENKIVKRDELFETLLKKYADVTRKVTKAIMDEEERKQRQRKKEEAKEAKEREKEAQWEKFRDRERETKKENDKEKDKEKDTKKEKEMEAPALREDKKKAVPEAKTLESPSKPNWKRDPPSRPSRRPSAILVEEKTSREGTSKYEGSIAEERSRNPKQKSVYMKWPTSSKEKRSKHETNKTKAGKNNTKRKGAKKNRPTH
ncbi:hypothetical protein B9Z55_004123 [Caenorhabditis nigoni]|uniref:Protein-tyrosine-phosphatase n=1 Tax=Caenorhabditis nigoni TaxID=1611254 RepID=A0A2G5UVT7_9PELO|nr:hypothetical protein B9Z55_004123 [Caenorhabditis nigoni]